MSDVRLIDATPIVKFIENGMNNPNRAEAFGSDATEILAEIMIAPTINPEDCRPQGRWEFDSYTAKYGNPYRCSQCKEEHDDTHNYCPNCGAKMDGKEQGDENT